MKPMLRHTGLFLAYELKNTARNPAWPLFTILQPLLYLLLFAPVLANASPGVPQAETFRQFTPGVMVMIALLGSLFAGFGMIIEIRAGVLERLAASPVSRPAIVLGRALRDMIVLVVQALLVLVVALIMGMRPNPAGVALMLLLMALTGLFAAGLSYGLALALRDENTMSQVLQLVALPVILLTGILLPMSLAPQWMQAVATVNPLYHAVEAGRALFAGDLTNGHIALAFGLMSVLGLLTMRWSVRSMRRLAD